MSFDNDKYLQLKNPGDFLSGDQIIEKLIKAKIH